MKNNFISYCVLGAVAAMIFVACDKTETFPDRTDEANGKARIRFYNASPNGKPVSLYVNGQRVHAATGVGYYAAFPAEYFVVTPGQTSLKVADTVSTNPVQYFEISQNLDANKHYSLFAVDSFAKIKALFVEDKIADPGPGKSNIRFLNLVPNSTTADVMITKIGTATLPVPDTLFKGLAFQGINDFRPLTPGVYDFKVNIRSTTAPTVVVSQIFTANTLTEGAQHTFVIRGFVGGTGTGILTATLSSYRPTF